MRVAAHTKVRRIAGDSPDPLVGGDVIGPSLPPGPTQGLLSGVGLLGRPTPLGPNTRQAVRPRWLSAAPIQSQAGRSPGRPTRLLVFGDTAGRLPIPVGLP